MLNLTTVYPSQVDSGVPGYPYGRPRNETVNNAGDGLPFEEQWGRDLMGFLQAIAVQGGVTPNGDADTSIESQMLGALMRIMGTAAALEVTGQTAATLDVRAINRTHENQLPLNVPLFFRTGATQVQIGAIVTLTLPDGSTETLTTTRVIFANELYRLIRVSPGVFEIRGEPDAIQDNHPINSIYESSDPTNPGDPSVFGFGTWELYGEGLTAVCVGTHTDGNGDAVVWTGGQVQGEYRHTNTIAEIPSHDHNWAGQDGLGNRGAPPGTPLNYRGGGEGVFTDIRTGGTTLFPGITKFTTDAGGGQPHNNIQPSIALYRWRRTA